MSAQRPLSFNEQLAAIQHEDGAEQAALQAAAQRRAQRSVDRDQPLPSLDDLEESAQQGEIPGQLSFDEQLDELVHGEPELLPQETLSTIPKPLTKEPSDRSEAERRLRLALSEYGHDTDGRDGPDHAGPSFD